MSITKFHAWVQCSHHQLASKAFNKEIICLWSHCALHLLNSWTLTLFIHIVNIVCLLHNLQLLPLTKHKSQLSQSSPPLFLSRFTLPSLSCAKIHFINLFVRIHLSNLLLAPLSYKWFRRLFIYSHVFREICV